MAENEEVKDQNEAADAAEAADGEGTEEAPAKSKSMVLILAIAIPLLLGVGGGAGYFLFAGGDEKVAAVDEKAEQAKVEEKKPDIKKAHYFALEPTLLVRVRSEDSRSHHARIDVAIMTRDAELLAQLQDHTPMLRNNLIDVIQDADYRDLTSIQGKKRLRKRALNAVKRACAELTGKDTVEAVLFTNYLVE